MVAIPKAWTSTKNTMVNGQCLLATRRAYFGHRRWGETPRPQRPSCADQPPRGLDLHLPHQKCIWRLASIKTVCAWRRPSKTAMLLAAKKTGRKNWIMYTCFLHFSPNLFHIQLYTYMAEGVGTSKDWSPMMVAPRFVQPWPQTLVSTKGLDLILPGLWPLSQRSVSKRFHARILGIQLTSSAAHTHTHYEGSGPIVPLMEHFNHLKDKSVSWRCCNWPTKLSKQDVKCINLFLYKVRRTPPKQITADTPLQLLYLCETKSVTFCTFTNSSPSSIALRLQWHLSNQTNAWLESVRICLPNAYVDAPQVHIQRVANAAFGDPIVHVGDAWCSKHFSHLGVRSEGVGLHKENMMKCLRAPQQTKPWLCWRTTFRIVEFMKFCTK